MSLLILDGLTDLKYIYIPSHAPTLFIAMEVKN